MFDPVLSAPHGKRVGGGGGGGGGEVTSKRL